MKPSKSMREMFQLSFGEELGNAISHGALAAIYLLLTPIVSIYSYNKGGYVRGIGVGVYMICIFLMLLVSCLYHSMEFGTQHKYVFRKLDHIAILLAIAGSYTPVALCVFEGYVTIIVLLVQWLSVFGGILLKSISKKAHPILSCSIYVTMGWVAIIFLPALIKAGSPQFLLWMLAGGLLYTIGIVFYAQKKSYFHFIWHIFIDLACICHFIGIVFMM